MKHGKLYEDDILKRSATVLGMEMMLVGGGMGASVEGMGRGTPVV